MGEGVDLAREVDRLRRDRGATILAHNYQLPEVQDVADFVGDSLALAKHAAEVDADVIVLCGVRFMAETAAILSPDKTVLLPAEDAGCPLADMVDAKSLREKKADYADADVVCYVNSSAEVKAESDICCTSSNAVRVVSSLESNRVLFVPDQNLASYVSTKVDKEIIAWSGYCITHHRTRVDEVQKVKEAHPGVPVLVHPECRPEVVALADFVGSTSQILREARESKAMKMIIGTEMGVLHKLKQESPDKTFYILSPGLVCANMKRTTLELVYRALKDMEPQVKVDPVIGKRAVTALERMIAVG